MSKLDAINSEELLQRENIVVAAAASVADWQRFVALAPMDFFSTSLGHTTRLAPYIAESFSTAS